MGDAELQGFKASGFSDCDFHKVVSDSVVKLARKPCPDFVAVTAVLPQNANSEVRDRVGSIKE